MKQKWNWREALFGAALMLGAGVLVAHAASYPVPATNQTAQPTFLVDPVTGSPNSGINNYAAVASASFTRPADTTAYALGDIACASTTAGSCAPMQFTIARNNDSTGLITKAKLYTSSTSVTNSSFRLHLYKALPTPSNGDNGAWLTNNVANYLGCFDVTLDRAFTDGAVGSGIPCTGSMSLFIPATGTKIVYGFTEVRGAYTPTSGEVFTWSLEAPFLN